MTIAAPVNYAHVAGGSLEIAAAEMALGLHMADHRLEANFPRWQIYQSWRHSLKNEPDFPIVVWALARK